MTTAETFYVATVGDRRIGELEKHYWSAFLDILACGSSDVGSLGTYFDRDKDGMMYLFIGRHPSSRPNSNPDDDAARDEIARDVFCEDYRQTDYWIDEVTVNNGRIVEINDRSLEEYLDDALCLWDAREDTRLAAVEGLYKFYGLHGGE